MLADVIQIALVAAGSLMLLTYLLAQWRRDSSIVDVAWGLGFFVIALAINLNFELNSNLFSLVHALVAIWGLRLFFHILFRNAGKSEDWRYARWRVKWGNNHWWRSLLQIYWLQAILMVIIAAPLIAAASAEDSSLGALAYIGAGIWLFGFYFEVVSDYQLAEFLKKRDAEQAKGRKKRKKKSDYFIKTGLWRYTRHPNYFGEIAQWWGLWVIVAGTTYGLISILSPLVITTLLLKVTGIPMLERKWKNDKEFKKYQRKTNALIPGRPR